MDDEGKYFKKGKPQQKFYRPGSGPLRKSSPGLDGMMENCNIDNSPRGRGQGRHRTRNNVQDLLGASSNIDQTSNLARNKKPEQNFYIPRSSGANSDVTPLRCDSSAQMYDRNTSDTQGYNNCNNSNSCGRSSLTRRDRSESKNNVGNDFDYSRNHRQVSEPRSMSPAYCNQDLHFVDRNRDSRSMETSTGKHHVSGGSGGKPPSGRRNSSGYSSDVPRPKYINIDNLPPRLRKKFLEESGYHSLDYTNREQHSINYTPQSLYSQNSIHSNPPMWSQTLPSRGRGRLRDFDRIDKEKLISAYLKSYESGNSRHSTPSSSNINIYESSVNDSTNYGNQKLGIWSNDYQKQAYGPDIVSRSNTIHNNSLENSNYRQVDPVCDGSEKICDYNKAPTSYVKDDKSQKDSKHGDSDHHEDDEAAPNSGTNLSDMTNLDWTEEVEKNIKLEDMCDSTFGLTSHSKSSLPKDVKLDEPNESKRSGKSRRREKRRRSGSKKRSQRSSSRSNKNTEKSSNSVSNNQIGKVEHVRKDSGPQDHLNLSNLRQKERERRDSHRSNRSSTIGNSRDDLDRWRSWRSYSREHSTERRIVSQNNSRDPSTNRAMSPRNNDGFRVPSQTSNLRSTNQRRNSGAWSTGRMSSVERGRVSPALSNVPSSCVGAGGGSGGGNGGGSGNGAGESGRHSRRRSSRRNRRDAENTAPAPPSSTTSSTSTNWREEILESKKLIQRSQETKKALSEKSLPNGPSVPISHPGLIILPQNTSTQMNSDQGRTTSHVQKTLYDHQNPSKPIIVQAIPARLDATNDRFATFETSGRSGGGSGGHEPPDAERAARHRSLLQEVDRADAVLQARTLGGPLALASHWQELIDTRKFLQKALQRLLMSDLWFCQSDNVEHHFWKILYYNFIEYLRKNLLQVPAEDKNKVVNLINTIIEEGNIYFEDLVHILEKTYKFNIDDYLNDSNFLTSKDKYVRLALISVQKLYIFLGDLARYKEQVNETNNYAKSKLCYTKAQQINPKNGRPYNQLAILAIYARRKLDAVYYYMRSLMSSNPFQSARESLISLFDENRKKYEAAEKKRRAAREAASGAMAASGAGVTPAGRGLRREVWVRPSGGRTTTLRQNTIEDHFTDISPVELNKNFITSYLHVHGKLITRIGMETFHESAALMLRQFRALLHQQPLPMPSVRLLQLTALNMFAVETIVGPRKDGVPEVSGGANAKSAWLECALAVSLLMFGALLERCCALLPEPEDTQQYSDALLLLPAIKVWSDWMLCHRSIWNPPPILSNYELGTECDPWDSLAKFMNILEALDNKSIVLEYEPKEGYSCVRLAEDGVLAGFTPLMYMDPATAWCSTEAPISPHVFEHALRTRKLLFFGTEYLVGLEPPVLKLEYPAGEPPRYVSAVQNAAPTHHTPEDEPLQDVSEDSEGEECASGGAAALPGSAGDAGDSAEGADEATRRLLRRKEQLEARRATMERRRQRMQEILRGGWVSVELEVRPRWLVPDTNCFIDHLPLLQRVAAAPGQPYLLAVPLVVVTELEGLRRCGRVGSAADAALGWLCGGAGASVRFATSRGTLLATRTFTAERAEPRATNDDRVLATALNLHANLASEPDERGGSMGEGTIGAESASGATGAGTGGGCVRRVREVVLLTDDRNLRVKALAAELPARDLPAFLQWAALPAPGPMPGPLAAPNTCNSLAVH